MINSMCMSQYVYQELCLSQLNGNERQQRKFFYDFPETLIADNWQQYRSRDRLFQQDRNGIHYPIANEDYSRPQFYQEDACVSNVQQQDDKKLQYIAFKQPAKDKSQYNCPQEFKYFENNKRQIPQSPSFWEEHYNNPQNIQRSQSRGSNIHTGLKCTSKMTSINRELLDQPQISHFSKQKQCFELQEQEQQTQHKCTPSQPKEFQQPTTQLHLSFIQNEVCQSRLIYINTENPFEDNPAPKPQQITNWEEEISERDPEIEQSSSHAVNNLSQADLKQIMDQAFQDKFSKLKDEIRFFVGKLKVKDGNKTKGDSKTTQNEKAFIQSDHLPEYFNQIQESKNQDKERIRSPKQEAENNEIIINKCAPKKKKEQRHSLKNTELINPSKMKQLLFLEENLIS